MDAGGGPGLENAHRLDPQRESAPIRPAATVLLLRDGPQGLEVLMTRRAMTASFAPGAYVFPGGGIDEADAAAHALAQRRPSQEGAQLTQAIAAIRESFEELGILLARRSDGGHADAGDVQALDRHRAVRGFLHVMAGVAQRAHQALPQRIVIIDDENASHGGS